MTANATTAADPWYTEDNVRSRLVDWLHQHGYFEPREAGTTAHRGDDDLIVESAYGARRRFSVRGYPQADMRDQARLWFASAVLDLARHRNDGADTGLALALPAGFATYTTLATEMAWLRAAMPFTVYWVTESGNVHTE